MTNREKAEEIANTVQKNLFFNSTKECIDSAMAMAKWKDEQFVKEKQALIDKIIEKFEFENFTFIDIDGNLGFDYAKFSEFLEKL